MASVVDYVAGTPFICRVRSSLVDSPNIRWFNTYELRATANGDNFLLESLTSTLVAWHTAITYQYVQVDQVTVSTWVEDSHPYDPSAFLTVIYGQPGSLPLGVKQPVSLRQTLAIKRVVSSGLNGKLFIRGALSNEDLTAFNGEWVLSDINSVGSDVHAAFLSSGMSNICLGEAGESFGLAMIGDDLVTRFISNLPVVGTSDVKLNHKYFDRAPTP